MKIVISLGIVFFLFCSMAVGIDAQALELQNEAFQRAMIAFGIAKSLNALISLIQGTEISLTPAGMGVTLSIGEILDPLNDMVERFSWVMLIASISLGIQKFLLILSGKVVLQVLLLISGVISFTLVWYKKIQAHKFLSYSLKVFILLLLLRFGAIVFVALTQLTHIAVVQNEYEKSLEIVENTKIEFESYRQKSNVHADSRTNLFTTLKNSYSQSLENLNIAKQLESLEKNTNQAFNSIVVLITVFVLESILLPLVYIWLFLHSIKFVFRSELKFDTLKNLYNKRY